jgi:hypothetical protein
MSHRIQTGLPEQAMTELRRSYRQLEHPSFAARLSDVLASPFEEALALLPVNWRRRLDYSVESSLHGALALAVGSMRREPFAPSRRIIHQAACMGTGAVGGFFGPLTTLAELPFTTGLMLRAIADVARSQGEDLRTSCESRVACLQVFALGGRTKDDEDAEMGYYGMRITLGLHFDSILEFTGKSDGLHIPAIIDFVRAIAARFGVVVSDKAAAQMIPIAGALSGATLNLLFMRHYQDVAQGHFTLRRLEREHGAERIRDVYEQLRLEEDRTLQSHYSPVEGW